jgi:tRNA(Ile2) C34 agmatinyltransferase TiaS
VTPDEAAALRELAGGGSITPELAAVVLCCPVCRGPVRAIAKPWRFKCLECRVTWHSTDIGELQHAVRRRVAAALADAEG